MQFVTVRDFRNSSGKIWDKLGNDEEIIVTNNSKPTAILVNIPEGDFEETLASIRQAKFIRELTRMREEAAERGFLSDEEIEKEIKAYRFITGNLRHYPRESFIKTAVSFISELGSD